MKVTADKLRTREVRFWPHLAQDFYQERAAIMRFDGRMSHDDAEAAAWECTVKWWRGAYPDGME